jgi:vancomycin resistance protein VanJ
MLTIMTFNSGNGLAHPDHLVRLLRSSGAHVIGLQELTGAQAEAIAGELSGLYPFQALFPGGVPGKGILSKSPVVAYSQAYLHPARPDLWARLEVQGIPLTFIVAHPPPPRVRPAGVAFDPTAAAQLKSLADMAVVGRPAILVGDFNMTARNPHHALFTSLGLHDAFEVAGTGHGGTFPTRYGASKFVPWLRWLTLPR